MMSKESVELKLMLRASKALNIIQPTLLIHRVSAEFKSINFMMLSRHNFKRFYFAMETIMKVIQSSD